LKGLWVPHDTRDNIVDYIKYWVNRTGIPAYKLREWLGLSAGKYGTWQNRYGKANEHNGLVPRDFWLETWEKEEIIQYAADHPGEGYRRLTFMMLDADVVAVSPSSVYRVLKQAGLLETWGKKSSKKGNGFVQPLKPHDHWHIDVSYVNMCGTFYYLCSILDGCSRYIVHWEIRETMTESDVEIIIQRALEKYPEAKPRIISDNGPQFIAKDFKEYIRISGISHVRTAPYYPQSNGKIERWHRTIKGECIRPGVLLSLEDARTVLKRYIDNYNNVRLNSAIGYIAPTVKLEGREKQVFKERDEKLEAARDMRKSNREHERILGIIRGNPVVVNLS